MRRRKAERVRKAYNRQRRETRGSLPLFSRLVEIRKANRRAVVAYAHRVYGSDVTLTGFPGKPGDIFRLSGVDTLVGPLVVLV